MRGGNVRQSNTRREISTMYCTRSDLPRNLKEDGGGSARDYRGFSPLQPLRPMLLPHANGYNNYLAKSTIAIFAVLGSRLVLMGASIIVKCVQSGAREEQILGVGGDTTRPPCRIRCGVSSVKLEYPLKSFNEEAPYVARESNIVQISL